MGRFRGVVLVLAILVAIFATTCSLQHETGATGDVSLAERYTTAWPPANWLFFAIGIIAAGCAIWIMTRDEPDGSQ